MESSNRLGYQNHYLSELNENNLDSCPLKLNHVTHDARYVIDAMELHGLTVFYQVLLMGHCYRWGSQKVIAHIKKMGTKRTTTLATVAENMKIRVTNVDLSAETMSANHIVRSISETRCRKNGDEKSVSFNLQGIKNLLALDWGMVVADYGVRLDVLAGVLNNMHIRDLMDWMDNNDSKSMPLILYGLQEYVAQLQRADEENAKSMAIVIPKYEPMNEEGRAELTKALETIRAMRKMEEKADGPK